MRPNVAPQGVPEGPVRIEFEVQFSRGPKGRWRVREAHEATEPQVETTQRSKTDARPRPAALDPSRVPRLTRLLVLGHHFERLVREGVVRDYAEIARLTGLSRARVAQITSLGLLAPSLQEWILCAVPDRGMGCPMAEHSLRKLGTDADWSKQLRRRGELAFVSVRAPGTALRTRDV